jgi:hypothetical protein
MPLKEQSCQQMCPIHMDQNLSLIVIVGNNGIITHDVIFNVDKILEFIERGQIPNLHSYCPISLEL